MVMSCSCAVGTAPDAPRREENYMLRKERFREHAFDMAETAVALAKSGAVTDKEHADQLVKTAKKVFLTAGMYCLVSTPKHTSPHLSDSTGHCTGSTGHSRLKGDV